MPYKESRIFTNAEIQAIRDREEGRPDDRTGVYYKRVRPKIEELIAYWGRRRLRKLLRPRKRGGG